MKHFHLTGLPFLVLLEFPRQQFGHAWGHADRRAGIQKQSARAAGEHVFCKVSALVEGTRKTERDAPNDLDFYRPVLDALWEIFGEDRLICGSNWPVSERGLDITSIGVPSATILPPCTPAPGPTSTT